VFFDESFPSEGLTILLYYGQTQDAVTTSLLHSPTLLPVFHRSATQSPPQMADLMSLSPYRSFVPTDPSTDIAGRARQMTESKKDLA